MEDNSKRCQNEIPLSRVKTIMKSSPDAENVSQESVFMIAKATEFFLRHMAQEAHDNCGNPQNFEYKHVADFVESTEIYAFLREIVPQKTTLKEIEQYQRENGLEIQRPGTSPVCSDISFSTDNDMDIEVSSKEEEEEEEELLSKEQEVEESFSSEEEEKESSSREEEEEELSSKEAESFSKQNEETPQIWPQPSTSYQHECATEMVTLSSSSEMVALSSSSEMVTLSETASIDSSPPKVMSISSSSSEIEIVEEVPGRREFDDIEMDSDADTCTEVSTGIYLDQEEMLPSPSSVITVSSGTRTPSPSPSYSSLSPSEYSGFQEEAESSDKDDCVMLD